MTTKSAVLSTTPDLTNPKIRVREKVSYALGDVGSNLIYAPATTFVLFYLTNVAGIGAAIAGTILLVGQLLNGITDIIIGILIDKTKTRWGKTRPWVLLSSVPLAVSFVLLFSVPAGFSETGKVVWTFIMYTLVMAVFFTASNVAYSALLSVLTPNSKTRVTLTTFRFFAAIVTTLAVNYVTLPLVEMLGGGQTGWSTTAVIFGVISVLTLVIVFTGTRERVAPVDERDNSARQPLRSLIGVVLRNKYFYFAAGLFVLFYLTSGIGSATAVYYATSILNDPSAIGTLSLVQFAPVLLGIGFMPAVIGRFGKRRTFLIGTSVMLLGSLVPLIDPENFALILVGLFIRGLGGVPFAAGMFAIVADVVDYGEWKYRVRADGLVYSSVVIGQKFGAGFGTAVVGWVLALGAYDAAATTQAPSAVQAIYALFIYIPVALIVLTGILVFFFNVERHGPQIREYLARNAIAQPSGTPSDEDRAQAADK